LFLYTGATIHFYIICSQACYHVFLRTDPPPGERTGDYNSVEEMIDDLLNGFDEDRLQEIEREEDIPGTFKAFREDLIEKNELMVPFYKGENMPLKLWDNGSTSITLHYCESFSRPWIFYSGLMGDDVVSICTMYIDDELVDEANEKGANWLINKIAPGTNTYLAPTFENQKQHNFIKAIYEDYITFDGFSAKALIREDNDDSRLWIDFVYENLLVEIRIKPDAFERGILKDLSFKAIPLQ